MYVFTTFDFHNELEFQESDVSPCQTEVKQEICRIYILCEGLF